jgi:hypothetical protein
MGFVAAGGEKSLTTKKRRNTKAKRKTSFPATTVWHDPGARIAAKPDFCGSKPHSTALGNAASSSHKNHHAAVVNEKGQPVENGLYLFQARWFCAM